MRKLEDRLAGEPPVLAVREALAGLGEGAWIVGGALRDALLGRPVRDVDLAVAGDAEEAARTVAARRRGHAFRLSEAFGAWRAIDRSREWVCDVSPLQGQSIEQDLSRRDFTVNALGLPLGGGPLLDPHGGLRDLDSRTLRVLGRRAYEEDPLRPLRLARLATELDLSPDQETERLTLSAAARVPEASPERVFAELRRIVVSRRVVEGLALAERLGLVAAVLPELSALRGVEQSHFHHLDVYEHTLEVLRHLLVLEQRLEDEFGELAAPLRSLLAEPLADDLSRGEALRFGALLHDVAKPVTRGVRPDGRITFIGHDSVGEGMVDEIGERLRVGQRLRRFLAGLTRHHLTLGFLVHERPLSRRAVYGYLSRCAPVEVEVTLLSCADRLATGGRNAEAATAAHLELARELMAEALAWRSAGGPPAAPVRGDELARELGLEPGPELGSLLARLAEARFAGEIESSADALELARRLRQNPGS